jgi:hypothetical protein
MLCRQSPRQHPRHPGSRNARLAPVAVSTRSPHGLHTVSTRSQIFRMYKEFPFSLCIRQVEWMRGYAFPVVTTGRRVRPRLRGRPECRLTVGERQELTELSATRSAHDVQTTTTSPLQRLCSRRAGPDGLALSRAAGLRPAELLCGRDRFGRVLTQGHRGRPTKINPLRSRLYGFRAMPDESTRGLV